MRFLQRCGKKSAKQAEVIRNVSRAVAAADVLCGLAELAVHQGYCCPSMISGREIAIVEGRHPVVEQSLPAGFFVPNSTNLGREEMNRLDAKEEKSIPCVFLSLSGSCHPHRAKRQWQKLLFASGGVNSVDGADW